MKAGSELFNRYLHRALNIGILVACALLVTSLFQRYFATRRPVGRTISLPGVDLSRSNKTLLLFLQQDCNVCIESMPFYRQLLATFNDPQDVKLILITPDRPEQATQFFKNEGLTFNIVLQGKRGLLGVQLSPTLILADSTGAVYGSWIGQLSQQQETEVWTMLKN